MNNSLSSNLLPLSRAIGNMLRASISDIPLVDTVISLMKVGDELSKFILTEKLLKFLNEVKDIPTEERNFEIEEIDKSKKFQYGIGIQIIDLLNRSDMELKPEVIGRLFVALIKKEITTNEYLRLCHIVEKTFYLDLIGLKNGSNNGFYISEEYNSLVSIDGQIIEYGSNMLPIYENAKKGISQFTYYPKITELGLILLKYI